MPANKSATAALANIKPGLNVLFDDVRVETGDIIPKSRAQTAPTLSFATDPDKSYLLVALDMDAPFPSAPFLSPILHWIHPGWTGSTDGKLSTKAVPMADWLAPSPPPGSGLHRYAFFLYEQPEGFQVDAGKWGLAKRVRFDLDEFERVNGLAGGILSTTYFRC